MMEIVASIAIVLVGLLLIFEMILSIIFILLMALEYFRSIK